LCSPCVKHGRAPPAPSTNLAVPGRHPRPTVFQERRESGQTPAAPCRTEQGLVVRDPPAPGLEASDSTSLTLVPIIPPCVLVLDPDLVALLGSLVRRREVARKRERGPIVIGLPEVPPRCWLHRCWNAVSAAFRDHRRLQQPTPHHAPSKIFIRSFLASICLPPDEPDHAWFRSHRPRDAANRSSERCCRVEQALRCNRLQNRSATGHACHCRTCACVKQRGLPHDRVDAASGFAREDFGRAPRWRRKRGRPPDGR